MSDEKRKADPARRPKRKPDDEPKGQYGGLRSLGPGGGRDIEDATKTEDIDPADDGRRGR